MPEKGQVKYGIEKVKSNIGAAASVAVLDILIRGAVRQVIRIFKHYWFFSVYNSWSRIYNTSF